MLQVGDFFEFYGQPAERAARILDIAIGRAPNNNGRKEMPFTGFPVRSLQIHLARLVRAGEQVVVCEQYQERHRNTFKRRVTRIVTPGTLIDSEMLDSAAANYLLAVEKTGSAAALAWTDISTGQMHTSKVPIEQLSAELKRIAPKEVLVEEGQNMTILDGFCVKEYKYNETVDGVVEKFYPEEHIDLKNDDGELAAVERLLSYIASTQVDDSLPKLFPPKRVNPSSFMSLPGSVMAALDLLDGEGDGRQGLFSRLTAFAKTGPGDRLMDSRLRFPSMDIDEINGRLDAAKVYYKNAELRSSVRSILDGSTDYERAWQRVRSQRVDVRDLRSVMAAIRMAEKAANLGVSITLSEPTKQWAASIESALSEGSKTRIFKEGFSIELDELYKQLDAANLINVLKEKAQQDSGIDKVNIVTVRGNYYLEVPRTCPIQNPAFRLDSTTASKLRYRWRSLEDINFHLEAIQESIEETEREQLKQLASAADIPSLDKMIKEIAEIDVASSTAEMAANNNYCRPTLFRDTRFSVIDGRHPIVEELRRSSFVRNSLQLNTEGTGHFALITGPNMGGKSTFLKQSALLAIMAQAGLYIPAASAEIGLIDAVFSRMGASDDLQSNRSTFMTEMSEMADILRSATPRSLILVDELGRGTAWSEGLALAWAVSRYLIEQVAARCLFATHYTELSELIVGEGREKGICLRTDAIIDPDDGSITPLFSVRPGVAGSSLAVAVARAAGMPVVVLEEAELKALELSRKN